MRQNRELDRIVSVANWLYESSPAQWICPESNAILVCGEDEIADALFDALFTTAFLPGTQIRLVRVAQNAGALEAGFIERNDAGLQYFTDNEGYFGESANRPLSIWFYEANDAGWMDAHRFGYAYLPQNFTLPEGVSLAEEAICRYEDIPRMERRDGWASADEADLAVLRAARRVHTAYTAGWNDRYREEDIDRDLYGNPGEGHDDYSLRSSLRLAVSIPWKMRIAGASSAEELYDRLKDDGAAVDGHAVRDYLAWQEHRSWQAFMTLEGWRMPSVDEMREYLFRNGNDHRDKGGKLHPCLCDLEDDWFSEEPGRRNLSDRRHSDWSAEYAAEGARNQYSKLDQMSMTVHHICKEIVGSPAFERQMRKEFAHLEEVLISNCDSLNVEAHFLRLRLVEKMFDRLKKNEPNSYHPFAQACSGFVAEVKADSTHISDGQRQRIMEAYRSAEGASMPAVERNKYRNYKEIDSQIIDWLPWIIDGARVDAIWKLYSRENPFLNLAAALILRPKRLVFVCPGNAIPEEQLAAYRDVLHKRGLNRCAIEVRPQSGLPDNALPFDANEAGFQAVDVSGAGNMQNSIRIPDGARIVYFENGMLHDRAGMPAYAKFFRQRGVLTVDETLRLKNRTVLSTEQSNEMLGMEDDYRTLWEERRHLKGLGLWNVAIQNGFAAAEQLLRSPVYRRRGGGACLPVQYRISSGEYTRLIANGSLRMLYDLQKRGGISGLNIEHRDGESAVTISMNIFPDGAGAHAGFAASRNTLDAVFQNISEQSCYVVDDGYVPVDRPLQIYDTNQPLRLGDVALSGIERARVNAALSHLEGRGLVQREEADGRIAHTYKSSAVRHGLQKEGFALEAYVYYTLFLSGQFDDVRSNVRIKTGLAEETAILEKEVDVLAVADGRMGLISCKDTNHIKPDHILELIVQAREYGIDAKPILICAEDPGDDIVNSCRMLQVALISGWGELSENRLINKVRNAIKR